MGRNCNQGKAVTCLLLQKGSDSSPRYVMLRSCCSLLNCVFLLQAHSVFIFSRASWEAQFPSLEYVQCCFSCKPYFPRSCANLAKSNRNTHNLCLLFTSSLPRRWHSHSPIGQFIRQLLGNAFDVRAQSGTEVSSSFSNQSQIADFSNTFGNLQALPEPEPKQKPKKEEASLVSQSEPEQPKKRPRTPDSASMADAEQTPPAAENDVQEDDDKPFVSSLPARRSYKYDDPPIIFRDVDVSLGVLFSVNYFILKFILSRERPLCRRSKRWWSVCSIPSSRSTWRSWERILDPKMAPGPSARSTFSLLFTFWGNTFF